jgi:hypothetical protein
MKTPLNVAMGFYPVLILKAVLLSLHCELIITYNHLINLVKVKAHVLGKKISTKKSKSSFLS